MNIDPGRLARLGALTAALAIVVLLATSGLATPAAQAIRPNTIVSLTFDDGNVDQYTAAFPILQQYRMHGTFYVITGFTGNFPAYMTLPQLRDLYSAGNEIASHTVLHPFLTWVSTDEATREICDSRNTLLDWGFPATDFAYPHSAYNATLEGIARDCGNNSARTDNKIKSPYSCATCPLAEKIPPPDPYAIRAPTSILDTWSLSDIESEVTQAEDSGGGWTVLTFHHICTSGCGSYSVTPAIFSDFLAWLRTQNVSVRTVSQVIGGPVHPAVSAPQVPPAPVGVNAASNPSLETADPYQAGQPDCWTPNITGVNNASFAETSTAHTGSVAETVQITAYTSAGARLFSRQDLGQCAPSVVAGDSYLASAWYQGTQPTRLTFWYRDNTGGWHWWAQSPQFAASSSWAQATWTTPPVPAGATALSLGLDLTAAGSLTTDDYILSRQ
jgi:peptidoglycan/xylan/chitin deacetylase (PgdA/CDA1 family)